MPSGCKVRLARSVAPGRDRPTKVGARGAAGEGGATRADHGTATTARPASRCMGLWRTGAAFARRAAQAHRAGRACRAFHTRTRLSGVPSRSIMAEPVPAICGAASLCHRATLHGVLSAFFDPRRAPGPGSRPGAPPSERTVPTTGSWPGGRLLHGVLSAFFEPRREPGPGSRPGAPPSERTVPTTGTSARWQAVAWGLARVHRTATPADDATSATAQPASRCMGLWRTGTAFARHAA